jgi:hypothetical protein
VIDELAVFPAASVACAFKVWVPSDIDDVFQEKLYGAVVLLAIEIPSKLKLTDLTPTLSEALVVTVIVPVTVAPFEGEVILTEGGVTSVPEPGGRFLELEPGLTVDVSFTKSEEMITGTLNRSAGSSLTAPEARIDCALFIEDVEISF